ncbi:N-acetylmuramoyl-L-alanine amidase [Clostridium hydrogeniformans]|uniref:N-acetylmuramoyl-L-alanine amidase n=1 Tax=Clostridium hydrogeniformans TaxID=349933 RepID=UPI000691103E|nr:N-acetylmuramoyl-L-alanine amidase [Clostridium hydrogeniformans]
MKKIQIKILTAAVAATALIPNITVEARTNNRQVSSINEGISYGANINGIRIKKELINKNYSKGVYTSPSYIVIHDTDNRATGANAKANRDYFANHNHAKASAHYVVDESNIVQALEDNWLGWHAGERNNPLVGNRNSIAIELCVNKDNDFNKTLKNGIELTKYLMEKYNIPAENVIRHHDVTGKICPRIMMRDYPGTWTYFKASISNGTYNAKENSVKNSDGRIRSVDTNVNIRKGPSLNNSVQGYALSGQKVKVVSKNDGWYKVQYNTYSGIRTGYISEDFVVI